MITPELDRRMRAQEFYFVYGFCPPRRKLTERQIRILNMLKKYGYNTMEICRMLNNIEPRNFKGCYFKFALDRRGPRCRMKERYCTHGSGSVDQTLRGLEKMGLLHSIKLRWFDGRSKGAARNSLQLDVFRFYYLTKTGLAVRLQDDIQNHLSES